jgi:EAL domain-containing protein (putative c-di-GMP-specific phosphodiesterase class I)
VRGQEFSESLLASPFPDTENLDARLGPLIDRVLQGTLLFKLHFQPIVDLRHACVVGYEALVRFPPEIGLAPDVTFQMAQRLGKRLQLEEVVIRGTLAASANLPPNCFLSINLSPDFLLSTHWDDVLLQVESLSRIVIEITEQDVIEDYGAMRAKLASIHALGGTVAVDDTGSGYSSLKHVMELKPSFVKLDRFFVGGCHSERAKLALIEMIGLATDRLDAWIIAEGVETEAELDELIRLNVPLVQGYLLGRPGPEMQPLAEDKVKSLRERSHALQRTQTIQRHIELCITSNDAEAAKALLRDEDDRQLAVVVDRWNRPLQLLENHPLLGIRAVSGLLTVQVASSPVTVLQRALTRAASSRFDPFVVIDEQGRFQGAARMDRLMGAILDACDRGKVRLEDT